MNISIIKCFDKLIIINIAIKIIKINIYECLSFSIKNMKLS